MEACFIAAYDVGVEFVLGRLSVAAEQQSETGWRARLRSDLGTYMEVLSGEPAFAWSLHVEVLSAGPAALGRRAEIFALFSERTRGLAEAARAEEPDLPELPAELFAIHTGGIDELVRECLRSRGAKALPDLVEPAVAATRALLGDRG